nr:uncharacterized protein CI109_006334 [Kwoniella shandongensis]KAA5525355.1 hypothetical protein CI109_006334 [Kwoniella shandongensis]
MDKTGQVAVQPTTHRGKFEEEGIEHIVSDLVVVLRSCALCRLGFNETVLDIPEWAFHTWRNDTWDAAVAQTVTSSPSPTSYTTTLSRSFLPTAATPSPTLPTNQSSESSSSATSTATSSASASGSAPPATKWAPVVGGIAGAMVLFLIFGLSWRYYRSRRKHKLSDRSTRPRPDNENDATPTWLTAAGAGADTGAGTGAQEMVEEGVVNPYRFASLDDAASPEKETNTPKKKKKKKRIPYPYPTDANSADHTAPEEDDNTQERDRHRSFLDMDPDLEIGPSSRTRGNTRRTTEMIIDPEAFAAPRPAPKIPSKAARRRRSSVGRYTTTQERLREKRISLTSSDLASPPRALRQSMISGYDDKALGPGDTEMQVDIPSDPTSLASPRSIASEIGEDKSLPLNGAGTQYVVEDIQDFSQPQPPHSHDQYAQARNSDATLPSLYSPRTGAATWRRSTMIDSPGSRYYPITEYYDPDPLPGSDERGGEMIGAALGSGTKYRDSRWDGGNRQSGEWRDDGWDNVSDMPSTHRQNGR